MYLLDTNVVSELRRTRPHGAVLAWITAQPETHLHLSAYTIAELQSGVEATRQRAPSRAALLEAWIDAVPLRVQILPMDAACFRLWARLMHKRPETLRGDAMIAATAQIQGLTVATRNAKDFQALGVASINPFENTP